MVLGVLRPIWFGKPVAAARLRNRVELILDYAAAHGHRTGENPARWSILGKALPRPTKVRAVQPHAALDYQEAPGFIAALRYQAGMAARALEFVILVAARKGEVLGMRWGEVDFAGKVWTVPGERMKGGKRIGLHCRRWLLRCWRGFRVTGTMCSLAGGTRSYRMRR